MAATLVDRRLPAESCVNKDADAEYLYRSKLPDIQISDHLPLHRYCFERLSEFAERPCLIDGSTGRTYSYAEVDLLCRKVAAGLAKLDLKQGEVVMILLQNCVEFTLVFMGASIVGAVATTANPFYTPGEIAKQAKASGARIIVTQAAYAGKLEDLTNDDRRPTVITIDEPPPGCLHVSVLTEADENECPSVDIAPDDVVALPYSSGTTGLPKGVMLTHRGLVSSVAQQVDGDNPNLYMHCEDVVLCVLPLFHVYSLNSVFLCSLRVGATILMMQRFNVEALLELTQRFGVTVFPIVPPIVLEMTKNSSVVSKYDVSTVRLIMSGAAPLGKELEDSLRAHFPDAAFGQGYGMTEAGPVLAMCLAFAKEPFPVKSGACGTVVRNAQMKIIDTETGISLPHNHPGEICIRGPQIMKGYLNDLEATTRTIDKDGWLHTGDVGLIDNDEEIFIVDRVKELIKYKGFQVPPAELEAILLNHPSIADAAVVPQKNEAAGEVPVAFLVRSNGSEISEQEIKDYVAKQVVFYKKIHKVYFVDVIPKSPSGKILRKDLRARLITLQ